MKILPIQKKILWAIIILFGIIYITAMVANHYFFRTFALDYGYYNQAFWDFAHFHNNKNTVVNPELQNFFQIHADFTLIILAPLYWLLNWLFGTYTLIIILNIFVLIGGYATYLLVKDKTNNYWIGLLALVHYFVIWQHFGDFSVDYNDQVVSSSIVPLFLYFFDKKKFFYSSLCFLFIISAKENMPIWFIFISLFLIITYWKDRKCVTMSLVYIIFSICYLVFLFGYFIPHNESKDWPYVGFQYSALGKTPLSAILFIINHPIKTIELFFVNTSGDPTFNGIKAEFYYVFLISGGVLLFLNPRYLIMFIPIIAQKVLNDDWMRWSIYSFYSIEVASILSLSIFLIIGKIKNIKIAKLLGIALCLITASTTVYLFNEKNRKLPWYDSTKENFYAVDMYKSDLNIREIYDAIEKIPDDVSVCASEQLVPHISYRKKITIFPYVRSCDYIFILKNSNTYPLSPNEFKIKLDEYLDNEDWRVISEDNSTLIMKKRFVVSDIKSIIKKSISYVKCDADSVDKTNTYFVSSNKNQKFYNVNTRSSEKAFSGKYSICLLPQYPYGFTTILNNVPPGSEYYISVWRYSDHNNGTLVATSNIGGNDYFSTATPTSEMQNGWKKLGMTYKVNSQLPDNQLRIYVWNEGQEKVFFDDLEIRKLANK